MIKNNSLINDAHHQFVASRSKELVNSWGLFDTLITRFFPDPLEIFRIIDKKFPEYNFYSLRISSQAELDKIGKPYIIYDIYHHMVLKGLSKHLADFLLHEEIKTEYLNIYPIKQLLDLVSEDDLVITDMYLSDQIIAELVRKKCGLKLNKPIIRSNWGKHSGTIWPVVQKNYILRMHFGDNNISDIEIPRKFNINTAHTTVSQLNFWENKIKNLNQEKLALMLRESRLRALPFKSDTILDIYAGPYLTLLFAFSMHLKNTYKNKRYFFLSRDSNDLSRIFYSMYPTSEIHQIDLSRKIIYSNNENSNIALINQLGPDGVLVDFVSTGKSLFLWVANNNIKINKFVTLIFLDSLLDLKELEERKKNINNGEFDYLYKQSNLNKHHYPLECLLQNESLSCTSMEADLNSGGNVRVVSKSDFTLDEKKILKIKNDLIQEFINSIQRRNFEIMDASIINLLIEHSIAEILNAQHIVNYFPSFLAREQALI